MRDVDKTSPLLHFKALEGGEPPGTFEAIISVFGNEDSDGEAVAPGAFKDTLSGNPPPITYSHQWREVPIGKTVDAAELDRAQLAKFLPGGVPDDVSGALYAKGKLHVDGEFAIEQAKAVYRNLLEGSLREFSWSGRAPEIKIEQREDGQRPLVWLEKIDLTEWGPCLKGANPLTSLVAVKSIAAALAVDLDGFRCEPAATEPTSDAPSGGNAGLALLIAADCPLP